MLTSFLFTARSGGFQFTFNLSDSLLHQILEVFFHMFEPFLEGVHESFLHDLHLCRDGRLYKSTTSGVVRLLALALRGQLRGSPLARLSFALLLLPHTFASLSAAVISL